MEEFTQEIILFPKPQPIKGPQASYEVPLFDWWDVVHIVPEPFLSKETQKFRKRRRAQRLAQSKIPEIVQEIGTIMNWFDDIEDFLVTATTLLRIVLPKIAPRLLPYVGWVLLVADIINLIQPWRYLMPSGTAGKGEAWKLKDLNPFGTKAKIRRQKALLRKIPTIGEWIEILQTTDQLFGVGLSFGPLIGAAEELLFGLIHSGETKWELYPAKDPVNEACRLQLAGAGMNRALKYLEFEDFLHYAVATSYSFSILQWWYEPQDISTLERNEHLSITPPPTDNFITKAILEELGFSPTQAWNWPLPGRPRTVKVSDLTIDDVTELVNQWKELMTNAPVMQLDWFLGSIMVQTAKDSVAIISADPDNIDFAPTQETSIMLRMLEQGISPYILDTQEDWQKLINSVERYVRTNGYYPTLAEYEEFATASKKEYMQTIAPMANIQPGQFSFIRPKEGIVPQPEHDPLVIPDEMAVTLPTIP